ncbi:PTS fructose transporter subunit IIA, partial [bacterium]
MKLGDFVDKERILLEIKGKEKDEVIEELASLFERTGVVKDKKRFVEKIKEREAIESTAI